MLMVITKLIIEGFKGFKDRFCIEFNESVNIIVVIMKRVKAPFLRLLMWV